MAKSFIKALRYTKDNAVSRQLLGTIPLEDKKGVYIPHTEEPLTQKEIERTRFKANFLGYTTPFWKALAYLCTFIVSYVMFAPVFFPEIAERYPWFEGKASLAIVLVAATIGLNALLMLQSQGKPGFYDIDRAMESPGESEPYFELATQMVKEARNESKEVDDYFNKVDAMGRPYMLCEIMMAHEYLATKKDDV